MVRGGQSISLISLARHNLWLSVACRDGRIRWTLCGNPTSRAKALAMMDEYGVVWPYHDKDDVTKL